jgi:hypothetical protein
MIIWIIGIDINNFMQNHKLKLGISLFILGFIGILSILTARLPLDTIPVEVLGQFSEQDLKLLSLINPSILLIVAVVVGLFLYEQVKLQVPFLEKILTGKEPGYTFVGQLRYGIAGGVIAGISILVVSALFTASLPEEFVELGSRFKPSPAMRLVYGGITEEILVRFGLMTFVAWGMYKIFKKLQAAIYWAGILIAALMFALGHLPIAFAAVANPSAGLITYIMLGNLPGGIIFGWLYWKKGLESAMVAHILTHLLLMTAELFIKV